MRRSLILLVCLFTLLALGAQAQMSISMTANQSSIVAGNFVIYTVTLTNNGGGSVSNPSVTMGVPLWSYVNFLGPGCAGDAPIVCTTSTIPSGGSKSFTISLRHIAAGAVDVSAKGAPNTESPNPVTVSTNVTPRKGDLALTASALTSSVSAGGTLTYRATVSNRGPNVLENTLLSLYLPAGVFAKSVPLGCADSHSAIQCYFGPMSPNTTIPLTFSVKAPADAGTLSTEFSLITTDIDTDLTNNDTTIDTPVFKVSSGPNDADLAVTLGSPMRSANNEISFTATVTNKGLNKATNLQLDFIAENADVAIRNISSPFVVNCSAGLNGASCTMPMIGLGAVVPVTFTVRNVDGSAATGDFLAHVAATQHDPDPSNNDAIQSINGQ